MCNSCGHGDFHRRQYYVEWRRRLWWVEAQQFVMSTRIARHLVSVGRFCWWSRCSSLADSGLCGRGNWGGKRRRRRYRRLAQWTLQCAGCRRFPRWWRPGRTQWSGFDRREQCSASGLQGMLQVFLSLPGGSSVDLQQKVRTGSDKLANVSVPGCTRKRPLTSRMADYFLTSVSFGVNWSRLI